MVVGFAAETGDETGDVLTLGRAKLARKGCDLLVVNEVGAGKAFGPDDNTVTVLTPRAPPPRPGRRPRTRWRTPSGTPSALRLE